MTTRPVRCALFVILSALLIAACGGERLDVNEAKGNFTVSVPTHTFPTKQSLSEHTHLVLAVRNESHQTLPNVAVTLCNVTCNYPAPAEEGVYAQPFAAGPPKATPGSAPPSNENPRYQVWIVDKPPGPCTGRAGYSCAGGSYGGSVTVDANTWAEGPLPPGHTAIFRWAVTAVTPGRHVVAWAVSAGLNGKAKAVLATGGQPHGAFPVTISAKPAKSFVNNNGQIVPSPNGR